MKENDLQNKIEDYLVEKRRILISEAIDEKTSKKIMEKLWFIDGKDPGKPILLVINTPGGSIDAGFAIWDQCNMIESPIYTLVSGLAASMGSVLCLVAPSTKRFASPYSRFMMHQPLISGIIQGQATDLEIHAKEISKNKEILMDIYVQKTKNDKKTIEKALDRDTWMSSQEAKNFGLISKIVSSFKEIK